jgi:hypothetical protein
MDRQLRSRSYSGVRDVEGVSLESETDGANIDVEEPSDNVTIPGNQFHELMRAVMREFVELKGRMKSGNSKISDKINSVATEMTSKIEVTNKNLDSLAKQFKEESESLRKEVSNSCQWVPT